LIEEPEETAVVVVQVVDQLFGVPGAGWIRSDAILGITPGIVPQQRGPAEHEQRRVVHKVQYGQQSESHVTYEIIIQLSLLISINCAVGT